MNVAFISLGLAGTCWAGHLEAGRFSPWLSLLFLALPALPQRACCLLPAVCPAVRQPRATAERGAVPRGTVPCAQGRGALGHPSWMLPFQCCSLHKLLGVWGCWGCVW